MANRGKVVGVRLSETHLIAEPTRLPDIQLRAEPPHAPWAAQS
jgi:hypothetical protein